MVIGRITKTAVDAAIPAASDQFIWDDEVKGFGLKVSPGGAKSYVLQYRLGGRGSKTQRYTIGRHGPLTPAGAKTEAKRLLGLVSEGKDPASIKRTARSVQTDLAFDGFTKLFLSLYVTHEWPASYTFAEGILRLHVVPHLKTKPLPAISRADITRIFDALPAGKAALRRNVHSVIRRLFRWAVGRGDIERSPMEGMEPPASAASRDRVLSDDELRLAWECSENLGYPFRSLYRLLIGTGQRREEVAGLIWSEVDRAKATWSLPAARAKNSIANHVHLNDMMIEELDRIAGSDAWPRSGLVLTTNGKTSVSGFSRAKRRLDGEMSKALAEEATAHKRKPEALQPWRVHDFRRTFATGMQRLGVRFEVTEAILNHVSGSKAGVAGVYQRHDWKDEKRAALDAWAVHISHILAPSENDNVLQFAKASA